MNAVIERPAVGRILQQCVPMRAVRTMLVPLDIPNGRTEQPVVPAFFETEPFLPAQGGAAWARASELPRLIAVRVCSERRPTPTVSRTPAGLPVRRVGTSVALDAPAACLSLWEVPAHGHVLACEQLTGTATDIAVGDGPRDCIEHDLAASLAPFGLTLDASPVDLFARLDTRLPGPSMYRPLRELAVSAGEPSAPGAVDGICIERAVFDDLTEMQPDVGSGVFDCILWVALKAQYLHDRRRIEGHLDDCRSPRMRVDSVDILFDVTVARIRQFEIEAMATRAFVTNRCAPTSARSIVRDASIKRSAAELRVVGTELTRLCDIVEKSVLLRTHRRLMFSGLRARGRSMPR